MKLFKKSKDGGPQSTVTGYWLVEIKKLFSIVLLRFDDGTRDSYHTHAFNSWNWVLKGEVQEEFAEKRNRFANIFRPSFLPIFTSKYTEHRVRSKGTTWVFSIRGPWADTWREYNEELNKITVLTHGRQVVP